MGNYKLLSSPPEFNGAASLLQPSFPTTLREWREKRGWTQRKLANELHPRGVGTSTVKRWEHGKSRPQGENLEALIALMQMDAAQLGLMHKKQGRMEEESASKEGALPLADAIDAKPLSLSRTPVTQSITHSRQAHVSRMIIASLVVAVFITKYLRSFSLQKR